MRENWSDEEIDKIKTMWNDGASASRISRALPGRSRNAVLGKIFRMNLMSRAPSHRDIRPAVPKPAPPKPPKPIEKIVLLEDPGPMNPPIDTLALRDHHCKWPYDALEGGYHYCGGAPKKDRPWCPYHCGRGYRPQQPRKSAA